MVALTTGMREGELLGPRWADANLDEGALYVTRTLERRTSRRQVLLVADAVEALKLHQGRQAVERRRAGDAWEGSGLVGMGVRPKIVSELLGHTQIGITTDLYAHVTATMQRDAVRAFEGLLGSTEGSKPGSEQEKEPQSSS